jgi:hypothetical protein
LPLNPPRVASAPTRRLIRRAKEFLDATFTTRIQLSQVAAAVDASPAYLTDPATLKKYGEGHNRVELGCAIRNRS